MDVKSAFNVSRNHLIDRMLQLEVDGRRAP